MRCCLLVSLLMVVPFTAPYATTYIVLPDSTGDFPTIQAAIDAAVDGDSIALGDGTFRGTGNRDVSYLGKAITVTSLSANRELVVIDCQGSAEDPHRGFVFQSGEGAGSILECATIEYAYSAGDGGAIYCSDASPTVRGCRFRNCHAGSGGGVSGWASSLTLTDCVFDWDTAGTGGGASFWFCAEPLHPELTRCTFLSNSSSGDGGAIWYFACSSTLTASTLCDNGGSNGAVALIHRSEIALDNTIIAFSNRGAAIYVEGGGAEATLTCCDLYGNAGGDWNDPITPQLGMNGNICEDPFFCDLGSGNLRLQDCSPCAPDHNPECGLIGAWPVGCDPDGVRVQAETTRGFSLDPIGPTLAMGAVRVTYSVPERGDETRIVLSIHDLLGRRVRTLVDGRPGLGVHYAMWDRRGEQGASLPAGVYFCRLAAGGETRTRRLVLLR